MELYAKADEDRPSILAQTLLRPSVQAGMTVQAFCSTKGNAADDLTLMALIEELSKQGDKASAGDLGRAEAMLMAQAHTLDAIFGECARRSAMNMGTYLGTAETYMRLGLKAQSQCRTTLETLAMIKNPAPVAFVKQANIAAGPQQVNNAPLAAEGSRARETENQQTKLLEAQDGQRLDTRPTRNAIAANPPLETVGAIDGAEDSKR